MDEQMDIDIDIDLGLDPSLDQVEQEALQLVNQVQD